MANQKLDFILGKPRIVSFMRAQPDAEGEGQYGHWVMYSVVSDGSEWSFFPTKALFPQLLPWLERGILTLAIEKSAEQGARGLLTRWAVSDPSGAGIPSPATPETKFTAELNQSSARMIQDNKECQIARSVSLKAAVDYWAFQGSNPTPDSVLITAQIFEDWLLRK